MAGDASDGAGHAVDEIRAFAAGEKAILGMRKLDIAAIERAFAG